MKRTCDAKSDRDLISLRHNVTVALAADNQMHDPDYAVGFNSGDNPTPCTIALSASRS